mgnify:CR=1 FL=1
MAKIKVLNLNGETKEDITLNDTVWNTEVNEIVLSDAIRLQMASLRQGTHDTKGRSEVSGGGRKPWRQKGTGRARQGSIRAAQWRKGGIVFGPTPRDYSFKINRKERVLALKSALVNKLNEKKLMVIDNLKLDNFKTKTGVELLNNLKLDGKVLFVASEEAENLYMATRNLNNVLVLFPDEINVYDILNADYVVFDEASIKMVEEALK